MKKRSSAFSFDLACHETKRSSFGAVCHAWDPCFRIVPLAASKKGILDPKDFRNGCILEYEMEGEEMMLVDFIQTEKEPFHHV